MSRYSADDRGSGVVLEHPARRTTTAGPMVSVRLARRGVWTAIEVEGDMDIQVLPLARDLLRGATTYVVWDLHGVSFMDTCGLGILVVSRHNAVRAGGCVRLVAPSRPAHRILTLTDTYRTFATFSTLAEALAAPLTADAQGAT
jgi:anti-anti-sigma factor